jgi:hypothetical protein
MPGHFTHIYTARRVADLLQSGQFDAHTVQPGRRPRVCVFDVDWIRGDRTDLTTSDQPPAPGEAHINHVTASQHGQVFGGYTVVLLG